MAVGHPPDPLLQLVAAQRPALFAREHEQQPKLGAGEPGVLAVEDRLVQVGIDHEPLDLDPRLARRL